VLRADELYRSDPQEWRKQLSTCIQGWRKRPQDGVKAVTGQATGAVRKARTDLTVGTKDDQKAAAEHASLPETTSIVTGPREGAKADGPAPTADPAALARWLFINVLDSVLAFRRF
jgi:hypothetical protein